ncbi:MAG: hypothetical protein CMI02_12740 [Oceanospirillaceae bacterium]|nr:hypothetical protein [Oceanospirillaceae bacterium]MBT12888.1 hypothetical protein [Oceanospirillaceae bacterium]|tara:strand:+ start:121212 stop:124931 length:3720 start_codon:yes stop_codon:yes gene_type:complete
MHQFDKNTIVTFDPSSADSISQALSEYSRLLDSDKVMKPGRFENDFDIEFRAEENGTVRRLQMADVTDSKISALLREALALHADGESNIPDGVIADDDPVYVSEPIFFAIALQDKSLLTSVREAVQAIVRFARRHNDTDAMWLDDMAVFGAEAVYMLACVNPDCSPLLGQFFIPYWDDEHAPSYTDYLASYLQKFGWCHETISAFIWCDNSAFRHGMFCEEYQERAFYQPLGEYLKENPEEYQWFRMALAQRLLEQPMMLSTTDEPLNQNPVLGFYMTLLPFEGDRWEEEDVDAFMQKTFISASLEDEATELFKLLKERTMNPLTCYAKAHIERDEDYEEYLENDNLSLESLRDFILALPQGDGLWRYIIDGSEQQAFDQLTEVDVYQLANDKARGFKSMLDDQILMRNNNQSIVRELSELLEDIEDRLLHWDVVEEFADILPSADESQRQQQYLRILDIFYRILNPSQLPEIFREKLTEDSGILSAEEYYSRYSDVAPQEADKQAAREAQQSILRAFEDMDDQIYGPLLQRALKQFEEHRELYHPQALADLQRAYNEKFLAGMDEGDDEREEDDDDDNWDGDYRNDEDRDNNESMAENADKGADAENSKEQISSLLGLGHYALSAWLIYNDCLQQRFDEITGAWIELFEGDDFWQKSAQLLSEQFAEETHGSEKVKALTDEQRQQITHYYLAVEKDEALVSADDMVALSDQSMYRDDEVRGDEVYASISEKQKAYKVFHDYDDDYQRVVLSCFWLQQLPLMNNTRNRSRRVWQYLIKLGPVKVTSLVAKTYSEHNYRTEFESPVTQVECMEKLQRLGVDQAYTQAYEISRIHPLGDSDEYRQWLDMYSSIEDDDNSMIGGMARRKAQALRTGLDYICTVDKLQFYRHLELRYPQFSYEKDEGLQKDFRNAINIFVRSNILAWEDALHNEFSSQCSSTDVDSKKANSKPIKIADDHLTEEHLHCGYGSWLDLFILQDMGDHYEYFAGSSVPEDGLRRYRGSALIFNKSADRDAVIQRIKAFGPVGGKKGKSDRIEWLENLLTGYLEGTTDWETIWPVFHAHISRDDFRPEGPDHCVLGLNDFIMMLPSDQRDRLARLCITHSYRGLRLFDSDFVDEYKQLRVKNNVVSYDEMVTDDNDREDYEEDAADVLLQWLEGIRVPALNRLRYCLEHNELDACVKHVGHINEQEDIKKISDSMSAGERANLVAMLAKTSSTEGLLAKFIKDKSRKVRDVVERLIN